MVAATAIQSVANAIAAAVLDHVVSVHVLSTNTLLDHML